MPYKSEVTQITCDIEGRGRGRGGGGESALLVELVEDRGEQGRDHLEGVERTSA